MTRQNVHIALRRTRRAGIEALADRSRPAERIPPPIDGAAEAECWSYGGCTLSGASARSLTGSQGGLFAGSFRERGLSLPRAPRPHRAQGEAQAPC